MKQIKCFILAIFLGGMLFSGCKDSIPEVQNEIIDLDESISKIPSFDNFEAFSKAGLDVSNMSTSERSAFEKENNFTSMQTAYDKDWEESQNLESYDEFKVWKETKKNTWSFDDDDFFTLQIKRHIDAGVVNEEGQVIIAGTLHNLKDNTDSFYNYIPNANLLKSTTQLDFAAKNHGKRRIEARLSFVSDVWGNGPGQVLEIRGYKKSLWKWRVYTTELHFKTEHSVNFNNFGIITRIPSPANELGFGHTAIDSNNHFSKSGHKLTYTFENTGLSGRIRFKVWSGGVPESYAIYVESRLP